jgi:hypothetical protein
MPNMLEISFNFLKSNSSALVNVERQIDGHRCFSQLNAPNCEPKMLKVIKTGRFVLGRTAL